MKKSILAVGLLLLVVNAPAQPVAEKLAAAFSAFENDAQLRSGIASLYVINAATGEVLFQKNARTGLAPASTQKIITAATAYEVLGKDFRYSTSVGYFGTIRDSVPTGGIYLKPSGDPTLGSWRWSSTTDVAVLKRLLTSFRQAGIKTFDKGIFDERGWESEAIPGGWIWDDIGNYYGAGADVLNWHENQYDLVLKSGPTVRDAVIVLETKPRLYGVYFVSQVAAAAKGTGDNSYIYLPVGGNMATVRGTIPVSEDRFTIGGAIPSPRNQFWSTLIDSLQKRGAATQGPIAFVNNQSKLAVPADLHVFHTEESPPLDSIVYWFLKRSINLYGEALAKTMAVKKDKVASAQNGAAVIRNYWKEKGLGIDPTELNLQDGSGLSPQNRVTTHAQVAVLQYARKQPWFAGYYLAFPEFNGMKLKSGTIGGAKSFCGYHTSKEGTSYIMSFIVNNYNGPSASLVQKMYQVLDVLK